MRFRLVLALAAVLGAAGQVGAVPIGANTAESLDSSIALTERMERLARESWAFLEALLEGFDPTVGKPWVGFASVTPTTSRLQRGRAPMALPSLVLEVLRDTPALGRRSGISRASIETPAPAAVLFSPPFKPSFPFDPIEIFTPPVWLPRTGAVVNQIPEPSTALLLAGGLGVLAARRRAQQQAA